MCLNTLKEDAFILTIESSKKKMPFKELGLDVCFDYTVGDERVLLVRKVSITGKIFDETFLVHK